MRTPRDTISGGVGASIGHFCVSLVFTVGPRTLTLSRLTANFLAQSIDPANRLAGI